MRYFTVATMFLALFALAFTRQPGDTSFPDKDGLGEICSLEGPEVLDAEGAAAFTATCGSIERTDESCWPGCDESTEAVPDYQFEWGDGEISEWGARSRVHTFTCAGGPFPVRARVRYGDEISLWSEPRIVACPSTPVLYWMPTSVPIRHPETAGGFDVGNSGADTLTWSVVESEPYDWMSLSPAGGSSTGAHDPVVVFIDWSKVGEGGTRTGTVIIDSNGGEGQVPVTATWDEGPVLAFTPAALTLEHPTTADEFTIRNDGGGTLNWTVAEAYDWLSLSPSDGATADGTDAVVVSIDWTRIPAGETRQGAVTIASDGGDGEVAVAAVGAAEPVGPYLPPSDRIDPAAVRNWTNAQIQKLGEARTAPGARLALPATGAARYVSAATGSDGADGSRETPWRTLQHAADVVEPNTTVHVDDSADYTGGLSLDRGGAEDAWVVFTAADPLRPPRLVGGFDRVAVIDIDASWVAVAGFEIADHDRGSLSKDEIGIRIEPRRGDISHVRVIGNRIHHIGPADTGSGSCDYDAHGLIARAEGHLLSDLVIDGNELHDLYMGTSECLVINGLVEQFRVTCNYVHDVNNIAIDIIGYERNSHETARLGLVADNVVLDASNYWPYCTRGNCAYPVGDESANGIYVDGGAELEIAYNVVGRCDLGLELQSENDELIRDIDVHHNAVFNSNYTNWVLGPHQNVSEWANEFFNATALEDPAFRACH